MAANKLLYGVFSSKEWALVPEQWTRTRRAELAPTTFMNVNETVFNTSSLFHITNFDLAVFLFIALWLTIFSVTIINKYRAEDPGKIQRPMRFHYNNYSEDYLFDYDDDLY